VIERGAGFDVCEKRPALPEGDWHDCDFDQVDKVVPRNRPAVTPPPKSQMSVSRSCSAMRRAQAGESLRRIAGVGLDLSGDQQGCVGEVITSAGVLPTSSRPCRWPDRR